MLTLAGNQILFLKGSWQVEFLSSHEKSGNGTGIYCSCPKCGDFWVIQSCFGPHHRLLKFQDCFHHNSDHPEFRDKWMYICPECGSDPSPADLSQRGPLHIDMDIDPDFNLELLL